MPCITKSFDPAIGPLINLGIAKPGTIKIGATNSSPEFHGYLALVDTGADVTCISPEIAKAVGLVLAGKKDMASALSVEEANYYLADLALPFGTPVSGVPLQTLVSESMEVMEFRSNSPHYQALLGRDIISKGLFTMTSYDKRFTICM